MCVIIPIFFNFKIENMDCYIFGIVKTILSNLIQNEYILPR